MGDLAAETINKRCIIIDDDQFASDKLTDYVGQLSNFEVVAVFNDPIIALQALPSLKNVDFIFLDVEMPQITGLELARQIRAKTKYLVFTTGYAKYALDAFELTADQFLLKPFSFSDFATKVQILVDRNDSNQRIHVVKENSNDPFFIKTGQKNNYLKINPSDVFFIEAAKNYVVIQCAEEQHISYMGLNHVEEALSPQKFIRIGKSHIVGIDAIQKIEGHSVKLSNGKSLPIGEKYRDKFLSFLNNYLLKKEL